MRTETKKNLLLVRKSLKGILRIVTDIKGITFLRIVTDIFEGYVPPFQRQAIEFVIYGKEPQKNASGDTTCLIEKIKKVFGDETAIRQGILGIYLNNVLPPLEAKYNEGVVIQDATDELLNLTIGKTVQEINVMIEMLKANGFSKKHKKCG